MRGGRREEGGGRWRGGARQGLRAEGLEGADGLGEVLGAAVGHVVAVDGGEHDVAVGRRGAGRGGKSL